MKAAEENKKKQRVNNRRQHCKENQTTTGPRSRMRSTPRRSLTNNSKTNQARNLNAKLTKSLLECTENLNNLVNDQKQSVQVQAVSSRASKINALNLLKFKLQSSDDNLENRPLINQVSNSNKSIVKKNRRGRPTLYEKSLNFFDDASNYSSIESNSNSSDGLITTTYNLNNKLPLIERAVSLVEVTEAVPNESSGQTNEINTHKEVVVNVIVPTFRIKKLAMGFRLEGTENTNDDSYEKKHLKLEQEEIRIQRWDMKRQRDEFEKNRLLNKDNRMSSPLKQRSNTPTTPSPTIFNLDVDNENYIIQIIDTEEPEDPEYQINNFTKQQLIEPKNPEASANTTIKKHSRQKKTIPTVLKQPVTRTKVSQKQKEPIKGPKTKKNKKEQITARRLTSPRKTNSAKLDHNVLINPVEPPNNKRRRLNT